MDLFIKKLGSNESGYSGNRPDQRGKFILTPKASLAMFPALSKTLLNDNNIVRFRLISGQEIAANIVYHNAKFFPITHNRAHNEVRLYRNSHLDNALELDRDVIIIIIKLDADIYGIDSVHPNDDDYLNFEQMVGSGVQNSDRYNTINRIKDIISLSGRSTSEVSNEAEVVKQAAKLYRDARQQQPGAIGDPAIPLSSLINTQQKFSEYLQLIYGNKCALRGVQLVEGDYIGADAAHVKAHQHGGPLLPTNGFLLSADIHRCFDRGLITLSDSGSVIVSRHVSANSELQAYSGRTVSPIPGYEIYKPYSEYCKYHRDHIFESRQ